MTEKIFKKPQPIQGCQAAADNRHGSRTIMYVCNSKKTKHIACEINSRFTLIRFLLEFTSEIF